MNARQSKKIRELDRSGLESAFNQAEVRLRSLKWKEDEDKELDPKFANEPKAR